MDYRETMYKLSACVAEMLRDNPTTTKAGFAEFRVRMKALLDHGSFIHERQPDTPPAPAVAAVPQPAPAVSDDIGSQTAWVGPTTPPAEHGGVPAQAAPTDGKKN